ncbi:MAG: hypothetical protein Q7S57_00245 [bacterium]|nr:hypothetical protein [bacterium]
MNKPLPFHELMVGKILEARISPTRFYIYCELLSGAVIPAGHDDLLEAILEVVGNFARNEVVDLAKTHILDQKRLAEEKAESKALELAEKMLRLDEALAAVVDDDDSATPPEEPETATGASVGHGGRLNEKERLDRLREGLGAIPDACRPCVS